MARVYNFSAGPAVLPEEVLQEAADEMLDYRGTGMSVMEMSHRSKAYDTIIKEAEADLRELMNIPDNYKVLFLQGGASQQFAMIPMNLMKNRVADYIVTGQWAKKAYQEASLYGKANKIASSEDKTFSYIPDCSDLPISEDADYVYICENNTIYGTKFKTLPNTKGKPLVADVSSCFLSEPVDVTKYGVIYGGVQKNIGPAGVVIVIIREDLITEDVLPGTPTMLRYKIHADADSLYNTPPAYGIYICGKVFKWLKKMGGLEAMKERNEKKAKILYDYLDESKLFKGTVRKEDRSLMNVPFITGNEELDAKFVKVKVNHIEREYLQTLEQDNEKAAHAEFAKAKTKIRVNMIIGLLSYIGEAVMVGFSIYEISKGRLSVGALVGALQLSEMLVIPTNSISYQISEMRSVTGIRQKIQQLLSVPDSAAASSAAPTIEYMELDDVSFRHEEKVILSHANYRFEAGKKYLILGENGSGKSTLFKLLTGLETEYEGCISVNGTDIRQLWPALYDQIGVVLQDAFIFDDTFLQNVTLYRPALQERAVSAMHSLGMDAFLASHDLDQVFQNTKGNLSGGERQKLALARVLAENKRVIFLDEATANMDKGSSQKILSQLLRTDGLTVISIEHKVSPEILPLYDTILELRDTHLEERA